MDRYAVIGNPIAHSKSPLIHTEFARQTGQELSYTAELVAPGKVAEFITQFQANNGKGLNVTVPFKQDAYELATSLTQRAQRAGAVNTLVLNGPDDFSGDTTDGTGLVNDLVNNHCIDLNNKNILMLGAGGAVRGVVEAILNHTPAQLIIANRTVTKAEILADIFADMGKISGCGFDDLSGEKFDLIINGTSSSLSGDLPPLPDQILNNKATVYDMMYAAQATPFMNWGKSQGAITCLDGLGMLVEQAAESFNIWRGIKPTTANVIQMIRQNL
ncbi:MAG: shikimate dehydrogenase [Gammaproteobacteria bacterium]|nr:shikimate dehydrogenase [Gammaproteobacteria bacterium]